MVEVRMVITLYWARKTKILYLCQAGDLTDGDHL